MNALISVVVPTFRRPEQLSRCLSALLSQEFDPSTYEIVIVDDAAEVRTKDLVEAMAQKSDAYSFQPGHKIALASGSEGVFPEVVVETPGRLVMVKGIPVVRYVPMIEDHGPAAARNAGWRGSTGEIIAFTDDDCIPSPGWLRAGIAAFTPETMGVCGRIIMPIPLVPTDYERNASSLESSEFVTANCFYRRCALEAVGGFDPRFRAAWREDSDVYFSMQERHFLLRRAPEAIVVHPIHPARFGISLRQQKKSEYNALLYKKHPCLYREQVQSYPPFRYYLIVLSVLVLIYSLLKQNQLVSTAAGLAWFLLTATFLFNRLRRVSHAPRHVLEMALTSLLIPVLSVFWRLRGALKFRVLFL